MSARVRKLDELEPWRIKAVEQLIVWLNTEPELVLAAARGRHAEGSVRHGDTLMYEYTQPELEAESLQELADAVNYTALRLMRDSP